MKVCGKYSITIAQDLVLLCKESKDYTVIERGRTPQVNLIPMPTMK